MQSNGKMIDNRIRMCLSGGLSLLAVFCLPQMLNLKGNTLAISNSWFSVLMWGICWWLCDCAVKEICAVAAQGHSKGYRSAMLVAGGLAFLFSLCIAFGVQLDRAESVNFLSGILWVSIFVWAVVLTLWIYCSWRWLEAWHEKRDCAEKQSRAEKQSCAEKQDCTEKLKNHTGESRWSQRIASLIAKWDGFTAKKQAILTICFLLLCWLPVFLAVYPGFFVYDAQDEFIQVQTRNFTTHHPLPHVLLLGGIILAVNKLVGSYNAGIAVYTFLQMCLMAGVFTYVVSYMKRIEIKRWLRGLSLLYFGLFPVNVMFVLCSAKDGIFSGAFLLLLVALTDMVRNRERFFAGWHGPLLLCGSALVMMSFRHNGMYAFLVLVPVLLIYMKKYRIKLGIMLGAAFASYFLLSAGLTAILSAEDSENQEMLTVPIQQLARTWKYDGDSMTREQKETLYEIIPEEVLPYYTAKVSDGVKIWFDNEAFSANPVKYMKLWAEVGLQHPFTYLNAWFMTSYGFWYPDTVIDVYRGNGVFTFTYEDSSFFGYEVEQPGVRESKWPLLDEWYRRMSLEITQQKVPVVSMLFSPGFLFWIFAFTGGYAFYRKKYELLLPLLLILLLWLTVILGPTYLPRYVLVLWFALPGAVAVLVN